MHADKHGNVWDEHFQEKLSTHFIGAHRYLKRNKTVDKSKLVS